MVRVSSLLRAILCLSIIVCLTIGIGSRPVLAEHADLQGNTTTTGYSGRDRSRKSTFSKSASSNDAIYGIDMGERSDDPCYLKMKFRDVASGSDSSMRYDECSGNEKSVRPVSLPSGAFVTGARVCLNSDGDKAKGIQLIGNYGACILGDEYVDLTPAPCSPVFKGSRQEYRLCNTDQPSSVRVDCSNIISRYYERTNCQGSKRGPDSDWENTVKCPAGQVATGMKLNTLDSRGDRRMFNGIALVCQELVDN